MGQGVIRSRSNLVIETGVDMLQTANGGLVSGFSHLRDYASIRSTH